MFVQIDKGTLIQTKDRKRSFSYETKSSMSFISIRRTSLWCPIMKRKEIIMWIHVCPNWQRNFDSKKWLKEKLFLWNQSINVIYPKKGQWVYGTQSSKEKILLYESAFSPIDRGTLILKRNRKRRFRYKTKASMSFTLIVPNH